jgi:rSAM/selenodomain-associated transferase 2
MTTEASPVTIVIPTLNDGMALGDLLRRLLEFSKDIEIRVADGGDDEKTRSLVESHGATWIPAPPGRGVQMNRGAEGCTGEILWFLHADNAPHPGSVEAMLRSLRNPDVVGGAFRFELSEPRWYGPLFRFFIGLRSTLFRLPYGDQGYFVRRKVFETLGGFSTEPLLEDVDFIRRLRKEGRIAILDIPIGVSPRRWDREGVLKRTILNWVIMLGYSLGFGSKTLARFYRFPPH